MLRIDLFKEVVSKLEDPEILIDEAVDYLYTHNFVDVDILQFFGGSLKTHQDRTYRYILNSFINLNNQAMYKLSSEMFTLLSPFIFDEQRIESVNDLIAPDGSLRTGGIDFIDFLRMHTNLYPHAPAYLGTNRHTSLFPEDLTPLYDKLITLREMYNLSVYDIINYCYSQTACSASGKLFDMWFDYVTALRPSDGLEIMPENLLFANNQLREKQGKEPLIYKLTEYSGGNFKITRRGKNLVIVAALPFDATNNQVDFNHCKLWFDDLESLSITSLKNVACDNRTGIKYGKLIFEIDIKLSVNSLVMVDKDDVDTDLRLFSGSQMSSDVPNIDLGTTWVAYYEGPSRVTIKENALTEIRKSMKITQQDAANAIHVNSRTLQNWEADKGSPALEQLIRMMYLFDFTDIRRIVERKYYFDPFDEAFKSGKSLSEIFPRHYNGLESTEKSKKEGGGDE